MSPDVRRDFQINKKALMRATSGRVLVVNDTYDLLFIVIGPLCVAQMQKKNVDHIFANYAV